MQALLGAMEQQEVTTAKAGVCATLPARTSVIAAANPSGGHYTRAKTVAENLKLSTAMLSRFDITFLLLDKPDEALDEKLSEHILALHAGQASFEHFQFAACAMQASLKDCLGNFCMGIGF